MARVCSFSLKMCRTRLDVYSHQFFSLIDICLLFAHMLYTVYISIQYIYIYEYDLEENNIFFETLRLTTEWRHPYHIATLLGVISIVHKPNICVYIIKNVGTYSFLDVHLYYYVHEPKITPTHVYTRMVLRGIITTKPPFGVIKTKIFSGNQATFRGLGQAVLNCFCFGWYTSTFVYIIEKNIYI